MRVDASFAVIVDIRNVVKQLYETKPQAFWPVVFFFHGGSKPYLSALSHRDKEIGVSLEIYRASVVRV